MFPANNNLTESFQLRRSEDGNQPDHLYVREGILDANYTHFKQAYGHLNLKKQTQKIVFNIRPCHIRINGIYGLTKAYLDDYPATSNIWEMGQKEYPTTKITIGNHEECYADSIYYTKMPEEETSLEDEQYKQRHKSWHKITAHQQGSIQDFTRSQDLIELSNLTTQQKTRQQQCYKRCSRHFKAFQVQRFIPIPAFLKERPQLYLLRADAWIFKHWSQEPFEPLPEWCFRSVWSYEQVNNYFINKAQWRSTGYKTFHREIKNGLFPVDIETFHQCFQIYQIYYDQLTVEPKHICITWETFLSAVKSWTPENPELLEEPLTYMRRIINPNIDKTDFRKQNKNVNKKKIDKNKNDPMDTTKIDTNKLTKILKNKDHTYEKILERDEEQESQQVDNNLVMTQTKEDQDNLDHIPLPDERQQ